MTYIMELNYIECRINNKGCHLFVHLIIIKLSIRCKNLPKVTSFLIQGIVYENWIGVCCTFFP